MLKEQDATKKQKKICLDDTTTTRKQKMLRDCNKCWGEKMIIGYDDYPRAKMVMHCNAMPFVAVVGQKKLTIKENLVRKWSSVYND